MRYLGRVLLGLGLPLAFAAVTLAAAWVVFSGPGLPWNVIMIVLCVVVAGATSVGFWGLLFDRKSYDVGSFVAGIAAAVFVIATLVGADHWLLHERGHDVACRVTAVNQKSDSE